MHLAASVLRMCHNCHKARIPIDMNPPEQLWLNQSLNRAAVIQTKKLRLLSRATCQMVSPSMLLKAQSFSVIPSLMTHLK